MYWVPQVEKEHANILRKDIIVVVVQGILNNSYQQLKLYQAGILSYQRRTSLFTLKPVVKTILIVCNLSAMEPRRGKKSTNSQPP